MQYFFLTHQSPSHLSFHKDLCPFHTLSFTLGTISSLGSVHIVFVQCSSLVLNRNLKCLVCGIKLKDSEGGEGETRFLHCCVLLYS